MTQYYPKIAELTYKDKWLSITIPIRIKKYIGEYYFCEKCNNKMIKRKTEKYTNLPIKCDWCDTPFNIKEEPSYKLYSEMKKDYVNIKNLLNKGTHLYWKELHNQYREFYSIQKGDLRSIKTNLMRKNNGFSCSIFDVTDEQLNKNLLDYQSRKVAKAL